MKAKHSHRPLRGIANAIDEVHDLSRPGPSAQIFLPIPRGIEIQRSTKLPRRGFLEPHAERNRWTALEFKVVGDDRTWKDDLFCDVEIPVGWTIAPTKHAMWSELLDPQRRPRAQIFYKAAFYDRDAFVILLDRFNISTDYGPGRIRHLARDREQTLFATPWVKKPVYGEYAERTHADSIPDLLHHLGRLTCAAWFAERRVIVGVETPAHWDLSIEPSTQPPTPSPPSRARIGAQAIKFARKTGEPLRAGVTEDVLTAHPDDAERLLATGDFDPRWFWLIPGAGS